MNNAEKYQNTKDALEAWRMYGDRGGNEPFDLWLSLSADVAPEPTLLEAAKRMLIAYVNDWQLKGMKTIECMENLREAVKREKQKPMRNCDVYKTAKEADEAYYLMCHRHNCYSCEHGHRIGNINCAIAWLYAEADAAGKEAK